MSRRGYSGYQGRSAARDALRIVLCVLVVGLVLVAAGLMLGQRYIVYTDDGVRLELPFFQREQMPPPDQSVPMDIVQLPGTPKPQLEQVQAQEGTQTSTDSTEGSNGTALPDEMISE